MDFSGAWEGERNTDKGSSRPALIGKLVHHSFQKNAGEEREKRRFGDIMVPVSHLYNEMPLVDTRQW